MNVQLHCGDPAQQTEMTSLLSSAGVNVSEGAGLNLVLDEPLGWASLPHSLEQDSPVVVSRNQCPTYRLDLLEQNPAALIYPKTFQIVLSTLTLVAAGETVHPHIQTPLTPAERYTVRYVAKGHSNKEIAKARNVSEGRIKNILSTVYGKLNLKSRVQLAHYYYGNWHLLPGWTRPEHIRLS